MKRDIKLEPITDKSAAMEAAEAEMTSAIDACRAAGLTHINPSTGVMAQLLMEAMRKKVMRNIAKDTNMENLADYLEAMSKVVTMAEGVSEIDTAIVQRLVAVATLRTGSENGRVKLALRAAHNVRSGVIAMMNERDFKVERDRVKKEYQAKVAEHNEFIRRSLGDR